MYGISGQWFKPFALTIASSVLVSLFVSFSLDPMLSAYWPDPQIEAHERRNPIARALDRFNRWFDRMADRYKDLIAWALDHRLMMIGLALATFSAALTIPARGALAAIVVLGGLFGVFWVLSYPLPARFGTLRKAGLKVLGVLAILASMAFLLPIMPVIGQVGAGFVPISDRSEISMIVEAPPGSNLEYTKIKAEEAARRARAHPEVAYTYVTVGTPVPLKTPSVDQALVYVRLVPKAERTLHQEALGQVFREEMASIGGAQTSVFTSGFGGAIKSIQIQMKGEDARVLTTLAQRAAQDVVAKVPGAVDVGLSTRGQKPELEVQLNRGLAGSLGITVGQVAQSLRPAFAGIDAGDWVDPSGETRDVTVRLAPEARERVTDLASLPLVVPGPDDRPATLPLGQVATITQGMGPAQIDHLDRDKVVIIQANVSGQPLTQVTNEIREGLARLSLPPGYEITYGGESQDQAEVFTRIFTALGVAVLLMYLILVVQFGSFLDPLAILVSLPLSLIGVVLALLITRDTLNIMSLIGVILLMGIVAKNAILLIDFAKWARERGVGLREALIDAGRIRLRPIIMTTLALIAGMIPVAIGHGEGADFRAPLGRAVIGGTITSTLLTLLVIPTVYEILDDFRSWVGSKLRRRARAGAGEPVPTPASPSAD
jgi:HAE1 family hydrophobic/amphiphilic exporter-1